MKYHYQYVSNFTVRIELVPEHRHEIELLEKLKPSQTLNEELNLIFNKGLKTYIDHAELTTTKFMNFPRVALCSFTNAEKQKEQVELNQENFSIDGMGHYTIADF